MKRTFYNTLYCGDDAGRGLVLSLCCTPVWESSLWFSVPAAELAVGRIIDVLVEFEHRAEAEVVRRMAAAVRLVHDWSRSLRGAVVHAAVRSMRL